MGKLQAVDSSGPQAQCTGYSLCLLFRLDSISHLFLLVMAPPMSFGVDSLLSVPLVQLKVNWLQLWHARPRPGQLIDRIPLATVIRSSVDMWRQLVQWEWILRLVQNLLGREILSFPLYLNLESHEPGDSADRHEKADNEDSRGENWAKGEDELKLG